MKISGNKAYELFISNEPFPLLKFVDETRNNTDIGSAYILAVIRAYDRMVVNCKDGRYSGIIRNG